jgi:hypothetical protein
MYPSKQLLATASALVLGFSVLAYSVPAAAQEDVAQGNRCKAPASPRIEEECACEAALKENTIGALEEFMSRYPGSTSACSALALSVVDKRRPDNDPSSASPN